MTGLITTKAGYVTTWQVRDAWLALQKPKTEQTEDNLLRCSAGEGKFIQETLNNVRGT